MSNSNSINFRTSLIQMLVDGTGNESNSESDFKSNNIKKALEYIERQKSSNLIILPEIWNGPYRSSEFPKFAERIPQKKGEKIEISSDSNRLGTGPGPGSPSLQAIAQKMQDIGNKKQVIVVGSIAEIENETVESEQSSQTKFKTQTQRFYNTSVVLGFDNDNHTGESDSIIILAKHRKIHLFDIDIPGKITFLESQTLTPGNLDWSSSKFQIKIPNSDSNKPNTKLKSTINSALSICYDIRFPEYLQYLCHGNDEPVDLLILPAAFNTTTGPRHWQLLLKARAVDLQCWIMACSCARPNSDTVDSSAYPAYGHSVIISPWGEVIRELDEKEGVIEMDFKSSESASESDLDFFGKLEEVRSGIPVLKQRRKDKYKIIQT